MKSCIRHWLYATGCGPNLTLTNAANQFPPFRPALCTKPSI